VPTQNPENIFYQFKALLDEAPSHITKYSLYTTLEQFRRWIRGSQHPYPNHIIMHEILSQWIQNLWSITKFMLVTQNTSDDLSPVMKASYVTTANAGAHIFELGLMVWMLTHYKLYTLNKNNMCRITRHLAKGVSSDAIYAFMYFLLRSIEQPEQDKRLEYLFATATALLISQMQSYVPSIPGKLLDWFKYWRNATKHSFRELVNNENSLNYEENQPLLPRHTICEAKKRLQLHFTRQDNSAAIYGVLITLMFLITKFDLEFSSQQKTLIMVGGWGQSYLLVTMLTAISFITSIFFSI
jgi:hypothetical protein